MKDVLIRISIHDASELLSECVRVIQVYRKLGIYRWNDELNIFCKINQGNNALIMSKLYGVSVYADLEISLTIYTIMRTF